MLKDEEDQGGDEESSPPVVIDIECFRFRNKEWTVKEMAVCGDYLDSIIFKPPHSFDLLASNARKAYSWITDNLHGIQWDSGVYPYERLMLFVESIKLRYPNSIYYAKGLEKTTFLEKLFHKQFIDLDDLDCPKITDLPYKNVTCNYRLSVRHLQSHHCARKKAKCYSDWLNKHASSRNGMYEVEFIKEFHNISINDW